MFPNVELTFNKKVLLRERKRHTARRVASTRCAALSNPNMVGGVPGPRSRGVPRPRSGGYSVPSLGGRGVPSPRSGGTPSKVWGVSHPDLVWGGYSGYPLPLPGPGMGYPLPGTGMGYPPYLDLRWGTPPTQT